MLLAIVLTLAGVTLYRLVVRLLPHQAAKQTVFHGVEFLQVVLE
jgi:hypothetical protein